jgi:phage tail protein X
MGFTEYITNEGDRWDLIAWKAYGDANRGNEIMAANPYVKADPVLPGGLRLKVPIAEDPAPNPSKLPPWKR